MAQVDPVLTARSPRRIGSVAGFAAAAIALGVVSLVGLFAPSVPFPPFQLAQAFVQATPGALATKAIETLGHLALPITAISAACAFVGVGAATGRLAERLRTSGGGRRKTVTAWIVATGPLWVVWFLTAPRVARAAHLTGYLFAGVVGWGVNAVLGSRIASRLGSAPIPDPGAPDDPTRRYMIRATAAGVGGVMLSLSGLSRIVRPSSDPGDRPLSLPGLVPSPSPSKAPGDAGFSAIRGLSPEITSNADFYTVDEAIVDPSLDPAGWTLRLGGLVDNPVELTNSDLLGMQVDERAQTLECISNLVGGDLISTAVWTGIPTRDLLGRAGADTANGVEVVFRSADGYSDSLPLEQAMDPQTLLAIGMNGRTLPRAHGFPARLLSVGTYGMKNPKWITAIEVVSDPYTGFWESRGWAKSAPIKSGARIDTPIEGDQVPVGSTLNVAGVAFAGDRGVQRVEVSVDDGQTWRDAELKTALGPYTWVLWRCAWTPDATGDTVLVVRATDGQGQVQTAQEVGPHPDGSSGLHRVPVTVA